MSHVNADGVLVNPKKHLLQEVQDLTNSLMAPEPDHQEGEDPDQRVYAANGEFAGTVGGFPHRGAKGQEVAERHLGAGTAMSAADALPASRKKRGGQAGT